MKSQHSADDQRGMLYLVGTPIGNLEDMTFRAIRILQEVDIIAAEDTRNTIKLCNHFDIHTPLMSYHEHNIQASGEKILQLLQEGKQIALVSDAGLPCISDPGVDIVEKALAENYSVVPIPGANAALTALIASGILPQPFYFHGFIPRQKKQRLEQLEQLQKLQDTMIFYEAPHRLKETLRAFEQYFGKDRRIVLARELTKRFEQFLRGTIAEALTWVEQHEVRGEFCIIVEGGENASLEVEDEWWAALTIKQHVEEEMVRQNSSSKDTIRTVAKVRGISRREVYQAYHVEE